MWRRSHATSKIGDFERILLIICSFCIGIWWTQGVFWGFWACRTRWHGQICPEMLSFAAVSRRCFLERVSSASSVSWFQQQFLLVYDSPAPLLPCILDLWAEIEVSLAHELIWVCVCLSANLCVYAILSGFGWFSSSISSVRVKPMLLWVCFVIEWVCDSDSGAPLLCVWVSKGVWVQWV